MRRNEGAGAGQRTQHKPVGLPVDGLGVDGLRVYEAIALAGGRAGRLFPRAGQDKLTPNNYGMT